MKIYKMIFILLLFLSSFLNAQTVYITNTGTKYHNYGCRYLNQSKTAVTLNYACSQGYGRCTVCNPPVCGSTIDNPENQLPIKSIKLFPNYPNPFNPVTSISYEIPDADYVILQIFDIQGKNVKTLVHEMQLQGQYEIQWDGTNQTDQIVAGGIYFIILFVDEYKNVEKVMFIK